MKDNSNEAVTLPGTLSTWLEGFKRYDFEVGGRPATVIAPDHPLDGRYWIWKGEYLDAFPGTEIALLRKGLYIVYLSFPGQFGSPEAIEKWNKLYAELVGNYGFARKAALIGLSCGGLYCYNWATANPEKVACIYGDAPVCDMKSWPGGKGKGKGSPLYWKMVMDVFGFRSEAEALAYRGNPIDTLTPLAEARIPILHVYGDIDDVVPWDENTGILTERYRKLGGEITLIGKAGGQHHPHGLADPTPVVDFIVKHTVAVQA